MTDSHRPRTPSTEALPQNRDVLLTARQLADRWQVSSASLANARSAGRGAAFLKIGGSSVRYRLSDIEAFEASGAVSTLDQQAA